jgi:hypothetical protein
VRGTTRQGIDGAVPIAADLSCSPDHAGSGLRGPCPPGIMHERPQLAARIR